MLSYVLQRVWGALQISPVILTTVAAIILLSFNVSFLVKCLLRMQVRWQLRSCRRYGVYKSNMIDQYDEKYGDDENASKRRTARIKAIFIHPVKSCGPIEVSRSKLTKSGLQYDRCFAFAVKDHKATNPDESPKWRFISQRTKPTMSQIQTELWLPQTANNSKTSLGQLGGHLLMRFTTTRPKLRGTVHGFLSGLTTSSMMEHIVIVPLCPSSTEIEKQELQTDTFIIHHRDAQGLNMGSIPSVVAALPYLKEFLGISNHQSLTLFQCTPDTLARTDRNLAPLANIGSPAVHGYTDQQPVNINSLSSVHALSGLLPIENRPLNALRFRANIWVSGAAAYDEESWKRFQIIRKEANSTHHGEKCLPPAVTPTMSVVCRTSRCTMPNVDPGTGYFSTESPKANRKKGKPQPSTALVQHRTVENGNAQALGYLGMHCVPEDWNLQQALKGNVDLVFQVGDELDVLERGEHLYGSTGNDY